MKKGFTLIELMIVVAIIGILGAIAIPKFADLIQLSKIAQYYDRQLDKNSFNKGGIEAQKEQAIALYRKDSARENFKFVLENYTVNFVDTERRHRENARMYATYRLSSGITVECGRAEMSTGSISLFDCRDGQTYLAQTNVTKVD